MALCHKCISFIERCDRFLLKPIDLDQLLGQIGELLALEWSYEETAYTSDYISLPKPKDTETLSPPPLAELEKLYELAMYGKREITGSDSLSE